MGALTRRRRSTASYNSGELVEGSGFALRAKAIASYIRRTEEVGMTITGTYDDVYARARANRDEFWAEAAEQIHWQKRWSRVLDDSRGPFPRWFTGGELNTCYNAVD